jgi:predicted phage-related endonuclease
MKVLDLQQGTSAWLAARASYRCASEAPIVMGASRHMSRAELVRMKATGGEKEFSQYVRDLVLARGHEVEAAGIAHAERTFGEELYPVTCVDDADLHLASFDGLTIAGNRAAEVKLWNEELAAAVREGKVPQEHAWQLEHQGIAGGLKEILFVVTDGTPERTVSTTYFCDAYRQIRLMEAWGQFEADVASYQHVEVLPPPAPAESVSLPALSIRVDGALALTSNLDVFGKELRAFLERVPKAPASDQDFVDCEAAIKTLERAEAALKAAEDSALAQTSSVETMRRTVASLNELARGSRLMIEKLVKARKESIRAEIVHAGREALAAHIAALNKRLGRPFMPTVLSDFPGAVKGKKTVQSLRDAVDGELARAKLAANELADQIHTNLALIQDMVAARPHLFPDLGTLVLKHENDLQAVVAQRIAQADEKDRARVEAEREKIRAQEIARIEREQLEASLKKSGAAAEASLVVAGSPWDKAGAPVQPASAPPPNLRAVADATAQPREPSTQAHFEVFCRYCGAPEKAKALLAAQADRIGELEEKLAVILAIQRKRVESETTPASPAPAAAAPGR